MGKHIDKLPWDGPKKVGTLPVVLGERSRGRVTLAMMVGFYVLVALGGSARRDAMARAAGSR